MFPTIFLCLKNVATLTLFKNMFYFILSYPTFLHSIRGTYIFAANKKCNGAELHKGFIVILYISNILSFKNPLTPDSHILQISQHTPQDAAKKKTFTQSQRGYPCSYNGTHVVLYCFCVQFFFFFYRYR